MIRTLQNLFRYATPVPDQHRRNFTHLYFDIFWFGILNGSTIIFLAVFATRIGATPQQIGLLTAAPAIVNLALSLPAGIWAKRFNAHKATCWAWALTRIFYLFLVPLPLLLHSNSGGQVWAIIIITLLMNIPATVAAIIGNVFFAETVPDEWRGQVVGTRNALLAAATMITSLISGQILSRLPFPTGYQIVFLIGFFGAALSCVHLFLVRPVPSTQDRPQVTPAQPIKNQLRLEILGGPYGRILILLLSYNLSVFIGQPVFPLYQVRTLNFTDATISFGTGIFWVVYFLASTQTGPISRRVGYQKLTSLGIFITAVSTILFILSRHPLLFFLCQIAGGIGWSLLGGGVINYLLQQVPADDRTPYLTWYNLAANAANLAGAIIGSQMASSIGLLETLILVVIARILTGFAILRWGNPRPTHQPIQTADQSA